MRESLRAAWPHIRAFLVAVHVFAVLLMALPAPGGGMNRSNWADPTVQAELRGWHGRLGRLGYSAAYEQFEDDLYGLARGFMLGRKQALAPFDPYYRYFGTWQSWRMFVAPHMYPARLHIDVRVDGEWRPAYVERSREHQWLGWKLDQDRFRSAIFRYSWKAYRRTYVEFVDWLAGRAEQDFPDATALRVRFWKAPSPSPAQARAGELPDGEWVFEQTRRLQR